MNTFLRTVDYPAITREPARHTEMDFSPPSIKAYSVEQSKRSVCLLRVCEAHRAVPELARGCWEGHLISRELAHLFSVWSTPPGHTAQCYRCGSGERLSFIGSDCSHSGQLGALPPVQLVPALKLHGCCSSWTTQRLPGH